MGRLDEKITRAAHIKRHTAGTSNEISFSVLDAAKQALDGEADEDGKRPARFGRITLFTLPGRRKKPIATPTKARGLHLSTGDFVSVDEDAPSSFGVLGADAPATLVPGDQPTPPGRAPMALASEPARGNSRSPEEEIARRKARRRLSRTIAIAIVRIVSVLLVVAGGFYLYNEYRSHQANVSQLDDALDLMASTDETLHVLDVVVEKPFESDTAQKRADLDDQLDEATAALDEADELARAASVALRAPRDKEAANQVVAAIAARRALLESGSQLAALSNSALQALGSVNEAWSNLLAADDLARQAAALVTETTAENVQASKDQTNKALDALDAARASLSNATDAFPSIDAAAIEAYLNKRAEALASAIASDDAFLAKNKQEAAAQNDAYNAADAEAAALAEKLPDDPSSLVLAAYDGESAALQQAYSTARSQAGTADAFIHDYLGAEIK